jgi:hypothetical protein
MKIVGVGPGNRRRDKRVDLRPIRVELEGQVYETLDWSLGGFLIEGYEGKRRIGDPVTVGLSVKAGDKTYEHVVRAEIVRIHRDGGRLAANFTDLEAEAVDTLEGWLTGRLQRMARRKAG